MLPAKTAARQRWTGKPLTASYNQGSTKLKDVAPMKRHEDDCDFSKVTQPADTTCRHNCRHGDYQGLGSGFRNQGWLLRDGCGLISLVEAAKYGCERLQQCDCRRQWRTDLHYARPRPDARAVSRRDKPSRWGAHDPTSQRKKLSLGQWARAGKVQSLTKFDYI